MRRRVMVELPSPAPEDDGEKTPKPERPGVVHRYKVPPKQYLRDPTSTATQQLEALVGEPPEILRKLEDAYEEYGYDQGESRQKNYESALSLLSGLNPTETTIQAFINQKLPTHQQEEDFGDNAGIFLSAMIQTSSKQKITLDVTKVPTLHNLCCFLENKEVTIVGDVGDYTAFCAKSGSLIIKGNAGNETGSELNGASVLVEGNAGGWTAASAKSGLITVKGNAGDGTGWKLNGASVTVEGNTGGFIAYFATSGSVTVKGNAGDGTGRGLEGALVTVEGNAGENTAVEAKSGSVTVKGNAGNETGSELNGASVVVEGNAGKSTASGAESGVIRVEGKIRGLAIRIGGEVKIVEARKQVWPGRWNWLKWKLGLREYLPDYTKQNEP